MLAIDDDDPNAAASALGLCKLSAGSNDWGLVSAAWMLADGQPPPPSPDLLAEFHLGHGLLDDFGAVIVPREGQRLLALSDAYARDAMDPGYGDPSSAGQKGYTSTAPPGGSPISLNGAPFDVCSCISPPCMAGGKSYACSQGDGALAGTGFETHAGTGWMRTAAPVDPGTTVTLRRSHRRTR